MVVRTHYVWQADDDQSVRHGELRQLGVECCIDCSADQEPSDFQSMHEAQLVPPNDVNEEGEVG